MGSLGHGLCWLVGGQAVLARRSEATFGRADRRVGGLRCDDGLVSNRVSVGCSPP